MRDLIWNKKKDDDYKLETLLSKLASSIQTSVFTMTEKIQWRKIIAVVAFVLIVFTIREKITPFQIKMNNPPIIVITLEDQIPQELYLEFPNYELYRFAAHTVNTSLFKSGNEKDQFGDDLRKILAITSSHIGAVSFASETIKENCALIIEDDVGTLRSDYWPYSIGTICEEMRKNDFDIVLIGYTTIHVPFTKNTMPVFADIRKVDKSDPKFHPKWYTIDTWGAFAYLVNPDNVKKQLWKNYQQEDGALSVAGEKYQVSDYIMFLNQKVKVHVPAFIQHQPPRHKNGRKLSTIHKENSHTGDEKQRKFREAEWKSFLKQPQRNIIHVSSE